jgi:hypothetical protein
MMFVDNFYQLLVPFHFLRNISNQPGNPFLKEVKEFLFIDEAFVLLIKKRYHLHPGVHALALLLQKSFKTAQIYLSF